MNTRRLAAVLALALLASCGFLRANKSTIHDIADAACTLFGAEHPKELRAMVPPDAGDPAGMAIPAICALPIIADIFLTGQRTALAQSEQRFGVARTGTSTPVCVSEPSPLAAPDAGVTAPDAGP